ncbi:MAG TPA: hypothetical protein VK019_05675 [Pseudomonas sp.]|nr:hypothetical protein [Pseudomonas sp.]
MPVLSSRAQLLIGLALAALLAMTRGHHFASVESLPSASWAVFFLAGALLRSRWAFPALFLEAVALDFGALWSGAVSDWCLSPAYWLLVPAYGALWFGGRLFADRQLHGLRQLGWLAACVMASALVTQVISSGGFYFFSGRYAEPTLVGLVERLVTYYPRYLSTLALYVSFAGVLYVALPAAFRVADRRIEQ